MKRPEQATVFGLLTATCAVGAICVGALAANQHPSHENLVQPEQQQTEDDLAAAAYTLGLIAVVCLASLPAPGESRQRT